MNPPSTVLGGVHGKVCWLIAYFTSHVGTESSCEDELEYYRISFFTSSVVHVAGLRLQNLTLVDGSVLALV